MYEYYYLLILSLAIIFFLISYRDIKTLVSIIIILIIGYYLYLQIKQINDNNKLREENKNKELNKFIEGRKELTSDNFIMEIFPGKIKYLTKSKELSNIIFNIKYIKIYDNAKFTDIINYMEKFMKIYIYILSDRYDPKKYFTTFIDIRQSILEILYSCFIIIPQKSKYIYGLNTYEVLYSNIKLFALHSTKMINTIKKYCYLEKKINYLEDTKLRPFNNQSKYDLP
jgi:hypothetical protein